MRLPRLSANGWLLVIFGLLLVGLAGEPAYRSITGRKSAEEIRLEKAQLAEAKLAQGPAVGAKAPSFNLKTIENDRLGKEVKLSDFHGRRVLVSFFCGCGLCRDVAVEWNKLQQKPLKGNPAFIAICTFSADRLPPFIKDSGAKNLLYLQDPGKEVSRRWGSLVCPRTWVVDEMGQIAFRHEQDMGTAQTPVPRQVAHLLSQSKLQLSAVH